MTSVTLADAKAHLGALVEQAANGNSIDITRRGKPVARLIPVDQPRKPIDVEMLRQLTDTMSRQDVSAGEWMRQIRDGDRY